MTRLLVLALVLALVPSVAADAAVSRKKAIWGPVTVDGRSRTARPGRGGRRDFAVGARL